MKKFSIRLSLFLLIALLSVELYIRVNHLNIDVPSRQINKEGIQLYKPNQTGYWANATHQWKINREGWPGELPSNMDSLVTLIGDSHIENFMNTIECNLASILNKEKLGYHFFSAGRSGVSLIEALEISNYLKRKYHPVQQFIFVKESDLDESIEEFGKKSDITQINLTNHTIINGELKSPGLKMIVYNIKTLYYFRNSFSQIGSASKEGEAKSVEKESGINKNLAQYNQLLSFISKNYKTDEITFFLHPETNGAIEKLFAANHLNYYKFRADDSLKWRSSPNDEAHWSYYGFLEAAKQIKKIKFKNKQ
jgi:hypothetical protein